MRKSLELQESFGVAYRAQSHLPQYSLDERKGERWSSIFFATKATMTFSIDVTGANIPAITPHTEWVFLEALDTLKFPAPWDITDFQGVLDHLKADGYYVFEGEFIEPPSKRKGRPSSLEC